MIKIRKFFRKTWYTITWITVYFLLYEKIHSRTYDTTRYNDRSRNFWSTMGSCPLGICANNHLLRDHRICCCHPPVYVCGNRTAVWKPSPRTSRVCRKSTGKKIQISTRKQNLEAEKAPLPGSISMPSMKQDGFIKLLLMVLPGSGNAFRLEFATCHPK